jgi:hypothetical protein
MNNSLVNSILNNENIKDNKFVLLIWDYNLEIDLEKKKSINFY